MPNLDTFWGESKRGLEKIKYFIDQIGKCGMDWTWWYFQFTNHFLSLYYNKRKDNNGIRIMDKIWDNLIILDACRYDAFEHKFNKEKVFFKEFRFSFEKICSRGSCTPEFLLENFAGRQYKDVVYITANPYVYTLLPKNTFFKVFHLWRSHWNDNLETVHPEDVARKAVEIHYMYPNKRLIIHFMQPHPPFIGKYRREGNNFCSIALRDGLIEIIKAYLSNLDLVFQYVKFLVDKLDGTIIITSDHGEAWGETAHPFFIPVYGHLRSARIPALIEVPWLTIYKEKEVQRVPERLKLKRSIEALRLRLLSKR